MGLKNDVWIIEQATKGMIKPFVANQVRTVDNIEGWSRPDLMAYERAKNSKKLISFGVSSYGYDMRVSSEFKIFTNRWPGIIDPKAFLDTCQFHEEITDDFIIIPPNSFALARSVEYFNIPRGVLTICLGKSTYARCGIFANITAFEPEWEGHVTIELSNMTPLPAKVYAGEGIAQVLFFEADDECMISYLDKGGKYQKQTGITLPIT